MPKTPDELLDELLVLQSQNGDSAAFERLVTRWQKRLWSHAYRLTQDSSGAWDVLQDSWVAIIRQLPRLQDPGAFPTWAFRIIGRRAADWVHERVRHTRQTLSDTQHPLLTGAERHHDARADLGHILQKLTFEHREVLVLFYVEELSIEQIARTLQIPAGTAKSRLHYARESARRLMKVSDHE